MCLSDLLCRVVVVGLLTSFHLQPDNKPVKTWVERFMQLSDIYCELSKGNIKLNLTLEEMII